MNNVIKKIDRAIKRLYNLDLPYRAEDFLLDKDVKAQSRVGSGRGTSEMMTGALYLKSTAASELSLGIFLSPPVRETLSKLRGLNPEAWSSEQMGAFTVAAEEISHFHYLLHHASNGRSVRQLELELHGEIDKFVLAYFAKPRTQSDQEAWFESLFEQLFVKFRFREDLTAEEKIRYATASDFAKKFLLKIEQHLSSPQTQDKAVRLLRWFYRLENADKISFLQS